MPTPDDWRNDRIASARAGNNPTVLAKLPQAYAVIGDTQYLPGYCVLLVDDPRMNRLTDLPKQQRLEFLNSMDLLGQAMETACAAIDPQVFYADDVALGPRHDVLRERIETELKSLGRYS